MAVAAAKPLTVARCDEELGRLAKKLHDQTLAHYEVALARESIDDWLERRLLCALTEESE